MSRDRTCVSCGKALRIGEFAYNQIACWSCFERYVMEQLIPKHDIPEERKVIKFMLDVTKETYGLWGRPSNIEYKNIKFDKEE